MFKALFPILLAVLVSGCATQTDNTDYSRYDHYAREKTQIKLSENITLEISPEIELLCCAQSQTSWMKIRGPRSRGNAYFRELKALAAPFSDHPAVAAAEYLTQIGFTYDAPPNFILRTKLPEMTLIHDYNDYLKGRAGGAAPLERFRTSLRDFAEKSHFMVFFNQHVNEYKHWLAKVKTQIAAEKITAWLGNFYGQRGNTFHIVLAPAMPSPGGYGIRIETAESLLVYQVIREKGRTESAPEFFNSKHELDHLTVHEFSHSYVNPAVEKMTGVIERTGLTALFEPVKERMKAQAYGNPTTFFIETVVRSVTIMAMNELFYHSDLYVDNSIRREAEKSFHLVAFTIKRLKEYQNNRGKYKTFQDFIPDLFKAYKENLSVLLKSR